MNVELARKALDSIRRFPDNHWQGDWVQTTSEGQPVTEKREPECGTTMCFAGWVAFLAAPVGSHLTWGGEVVFPNGNSELVSRYATQQLSLLDDDDHDQGGAFYYDARDVDDLGNVIDLVEQSPGIDRDAIYTAMHGRSRYDPN